MREGLPRYPGLIKVRCCVRYALDSLPGIAQRIGGEDQETYYVFSGFQPTIAGRAKPHSAGRQPPG